MQNTIEQRTLRKIYLRVLPFAILTYFLCYIDRMAALWLNIPARAAQPVAAEWGRGATVTAMVG